MTRTLRRFTPEEDDILRADYKEYAPLRAIGIKLSRDVGTLTQRIRTLGLTRDGNVTRMLKWCPEHLVPVLKEKGSAAFLEIAEKDRGEQDKKLSDEAHAVIAAQIAAIEARPELVRKERMMAMRVIGLTLEEIGGRYGITKERVRQLTDPDFESTKPRTGSLDHLLAAHAKLEAQVANNKLRIKAKAFDTLMSCWKASDKDTRSEFLKAIKSR